MRKIANLVKNISKGCWDELLEGLYGSGIAEERERYTALLGEFSRSFNTAEARLFSAPGRAEIGGNHTDHNNGRVLAAGVSLDTLAAAAPAKGKIITIHSEGYPQIQVDLSRLEPQPGEGQTAAAVVRGVARGFADEGHEIGGFNASITTRVLKGSGLSSSASFEILIGAILNGLFNGGEAGLTALARIGQFAENQFYGKPCGLMDQMACAHAGLAAIDFEDPAKPKLDRLTLRFETMGHRLMVVNTRGDHAGLSENYADIPREMKAAAALLGRKTLRGVTMAELLGQASCIRSSAGDRAFLRAYHFVGENDRVAEQLFSLKEGNIRTFINLMNESGRSSFQYLQNVFLCETPAHQEMSLGIAAAEVLLEGGGAVRVHGGGFAGTILALVPMDREVSFTEGMNRLFGDGAVQPLTIRNFPAGEVKGV